MSLADSIRQTASIARWMSGAVTAPDQTTSILRGKRREFASLLGGRLQVGEAQPRTSADHLVHVEEHDAMTFAKNGPARASTR